MSPGNKGPAETSGLLSMLSKTLQAYLTAFNEVAIVTLTDLNGKIIYANDKFVEISQYSREELIGKTHHIVNSGYHSKDFFAEMWRTIVDSKPWRGEIKNKAKDGSYYWVDTVITPVKDKNNKSFQFLSIRNLITTQKEHEEKLAAYQKELLSKSEQLYEAQMVAKTGSWYINIPDNSLQWSDEAYRIFEIPVGTPMNYDKFLERVHPDDRQTVQIHWEKALTTGFYEVEHRIITASGEKWVNERARLNIEPPDKLKKVIGTVQDISDKKKNENALKESEAMYRGLFNESPFAVGLMDTSTMRFLEVNETATKLYGYTREEFLKLDVYDIRVPEEHSKLSSIISEGRYVMDKSIRPHRKKNGDIIFVEPAINEINFKNKKVYLISINDLTEKIKIEEELVAEKYNRQKVVDRAALEAEERSRAGIGRELHDNINQLLVASTLFLKKTQPATEKDAGLLANGVKIIGNAIEEIRLLSSHFVPPSLNNLGLEDSIRYLSSSLKMAGVLVQLEVNITEEKLEETFKVNIYRIIQEQFNNIIKYAGATQVTVKIIQQKNELLLEVTDNGKGFDKEKIISGIGLANIRHRATLYNGKTEIISSPGNGCSISITFFLS